MVEELKISKSRRGAPLIVMNNYSFSKDEALANKIYWKCTKAPFCKSGICTDLSMKTLLSHSGIHNHAQEDMKKKGQDINFCDLVKKHPFVCPQMIINKFHGLNSASSILPTESKLRQRITNF